MRFNLKRELELLKASTKSLSDSAKTLMCVAEDNRQNNDKLIALQKDLVASSERIKLMNAETIAIYERIKSRNSKLRREASVIMVKVPEPIEVTGWHIIV